MGSYNKWFVSSNCPETCTIYKNIQQYIDNHALSWVWKGWSESTKYSPEKEMIPLSKAFPGIIFSCEASGEYPFKSFYLNGVEVPDYWALLKRWPSVSGMRSGKKKMDAYEKARKIKNKKLEEEQASKDRLAKITELENQLKQLKTG